MGWSSGVDVFRSSWEALRPFIAKGRRVTAAAELIQVFQEADCDNLDELEGKWPEFDDALRLAYGRRQPPPGRSGVQP